MTQTITYSYAIEERITELQARIAELEADLARSRAAYNRLSEKETFRDHLFEVEADTLTASHKASIDATVRYLRDQKCNQDERGYIKMDAHACAVMAGQSYGTLLNNWSTLSRELRMRDGQEIETDVGNVPIFDRLVVRVLTKDQEHYPQGYYLETWMKERAITYHPDQYKPQVPIEWGGKRKEAGRKKCKKCGATMKVKDHIRKVQREHICPNCGTQEWDEERRVSDEVRVNGPVEQPEGGKNQVDFCPPESLANAEIEGSKPPLDEVYPSPLLPQDGVYSTGSVNTCLPPRWLRRKKVWCPWRYEEPEKPRADGKLDKVPYQTRGRVPQKAKTNEACTWSTYEQAQAFYEQSVQEGWKRPFDGIGFMCDGSFVGIDLDHCRDKETGEIAAWAQAIIDRFPGAYLYVTPSREGVRLVIGGKKPGPRCKKGDIEIYEDVRFFTWRPLPLAEASDELVDCQAALDALYKEVFPDVPKPALPNVVNSQHFTSSRTDDEILKKARGAANGAKFIDLYDQGNWQAYAYPSQSEADEGLCEMLAYWGDGDVSTIDRLFRDSKLYRAERWDAPARAGETYGEGTIKRAIEMWQRKQVAV
jgi:hypothetical protein